MNALTLKPSGVATGHSNFYTPPPYLSNALFLRSGQKMEYGIFLFFFYLQYQYIAIYKMLSPVFYWRWPVGIWTLVFNYSPWETVLHHSPSVTITPSTGKCVLKFEPPNIPFYSCVLISHGLWMKVRLELTLFWLKPRCFSHVNC